MYTVIGTTDKGERYAIGHTTSRNKAENFVKEFEMRVADGMPLTDEMAIYSYLDVYASTQLNVTAMRPY